MESENGKEVQSFSETLRVVLAKIFMEGCRLFQRVRGQFVERVVEYFRGRYNIRGQRNIVR